MIRTLYSSVLMALLLSCAGCGGFLSYSRITVNDPITPEDVRFIVPGQTSLQDVVGRLGTPDEIKRVTDGVMAVFHFRDSRYSRANFGLAGSYFLPVSPDLIISDSGLGTDWFQVVVDANWVVRGLAFSRHVDQSQLFPWPFRTNPHRSS